MTINKGKLAEALERPIIGCRDLTDEDMDKINVLDKAARTLADLLPHLEKLQGWNSDVESAELSKEYKVLWFGREYYGRRLSDKIITGESIWLVLVDPIPRLSISAIPTHYKPVDTPGTCPIKAIKEILGGTNQLNPEIKFAFNAFEKLIRDCEASNRAGCLPVIDLSDAHIIRATLNHAAKSYESDLVPL